jgi:NAD-reducing hydrogenase small subunit
MKKVATVWLDGCSGCHMSFLDMDERLIEIAGEIELVFSPYIDIKEYPSSVDIALVEGSISSQEDVEKIKKIRENTKTIIAFGDCAITGNISAMKNQYGTEEVLKRGYTELSCNGVIPTEVVPKLLDKVVPLYEVVDIEYFLQGCPPPSEAIYETLKSLINDETPNISQFTRFGK